MVRDATATSWSLGITIGLIAGYRQNRILPVQDKIKIWTGAPDMSSLHPVPLHTQRSKSECNNGYRAGISIFGCACKWESTESLSVGKITTQNVDQYSFSDFNELILYEFESHPAPGDVEDQRIMLWDNLFLRKTAIVTNNIYERASTNKLMFVDHPLYRPNMALIKFIFCELTCELACRVNYTWKITTMKENKVDIFSRITRNRQMHNTFIYCDYPH